MPRVLETDRSGIELAAALKVMAIGVGTYEAALLIEKLEAANGAELPPVFLPFLRGLRLRQFSSPFERLARALDTVRLKDHLGLPFSPARGPVSVLDIDSRLGQPFRH